MTNTTDDTPFVSIVVPNYNEGQYLDKAIPSLLDLDYPPNCFEVIVVDNGSTDGSVETIRKYPVKLIEEPGIKVGAVRNRGVDVCRGGFIAFIDADCIAPKTWIKSAVQVMMENDGIGAVGGGCKAPTDSPWVVSAWVNNEALDSFDANALPGASFIVRKDVFSSLAGFDESIVAGEDDDLSYRIIKAGYKLCRLKDCYVTHLGYPTSLLGILKRQIWHGTNQLQAASGVVDKMLLITHFYMLGLLLLVMGVVGVAPSIFSATGFIGVTVPPFLLAINRARMTAAEKRSIAHCLQLTVIYSFFLMGRCIGLVKNYVCIIKACLKPN